MEASSILWEDELIKKLFEDDKDHHASSLPLQPSYANNSLSSDDQQSACSTSSSETYDQLMPLHRLMSPVYSGPTLTDISNALSHTTETLLPKDLSHSRLSELDKGSNKSENKYTLKIKSIGGAGLAEDGYKWRKYGQKYIKNSPNPRSYYKCTNPRCGAKKQVERSLEDPDTLVITYEGLHLHFAYPYFLKAQEENSPSKKAKKIRSEEQEETGTKVLQNIADETPIVTHETQSKKNNHEEHESKLATQGLLEDIVPLLVRNPSSNDNMFSSSSSSSSPYPSPPGSPSVTWPHFFPLICNP